MKSPEFWILGPVHLLKKWINGIISRVQLYKKRVSCFDIGEVELEQLSFLPFIYTFEHCELIQNSGQNSCDNIRIEFDEPYSNKVELCIFKLNKNSMKPQIREQMSGPKIS